MVNDVMELRRRRDALIAVDGPWTAADFELGGGLRTMARERRDDDDRLTFVVQTMCDLVAPRRDARVLDLGCLEGFFSIELARQGFTVVGIDARPENLRKARFVAEALDVGNVRFVEGDVRALDSAALGQFDAVLCLGILQHVDAPHVPAFINSIARACTHVAVFDTHVSLLPSRRVDFEGRSYRGALYPERQRGETASDQRARTWAAIDNEMSFWPTKRSLLRMIAAAGFTTIFEVASPPVDAPIDRVRLVALRGTQVRFASIPQPPASEALLGEHGMRDLMGALQSMRMRVVPRLPAWTRALSRRVRGRG